MSDHQTPEEIEKLKVNWSKDPCWDIEDTEGFEAHHDELLKWREEREADLQREAEEYIAHRARVVAIETGVTNSDIQKNIHTFAEIENDVNRALSYESSTDLAAAQVRATLLLTAQIARVADALDAIQCVYETGDARDSLAESVRIWGTEK